MVLGIDVIKLIFFPNVYLNPYLVVFSSIIFSCLLFKITRKPKILVFVAIFFIGIFTDAELIAFKIMARKETKFSSVVTYFRDDLKSTPCSKTLDFTDSDDENKKRYYCVTSPLHYFKVGDQIDVSKNKNLFGYEYKIKARS